MHAQKINPKAYICNCERSYLSVIIATEIFLSTPYKTSKVGPWTFFRTGKQLFFQRVEQTQPLIKRYFLRSGVW